MSRWAAVLVAVVATLAVGGFAEPLKNLSPKFKQPHIVADKVFLKKQMELMGLFYHIYEPLQDTERKTIADTWSLEKNIESYKNNTAVKTYIELMKMKWNLPREVPFSIYNPTQLFEAKTLYYLFYSSKDYDTFYKTAVYLRDRVNENLYVYSLGIAIINYPETQGIILPPIYEIFPSYFFNGQIMNTAQRIKTQGKSMLEYYNDAYFWKDEFVIKWNETVWPYNFKDYSLSYFTNSYYINGLSYNFHISSPFWLSGEEGPLAKLNRGEYFWFLFKQYLTHYYLERLSNGLGEIPELNFEMIEQGYDSGLIYQNGIPFPSRPNYLNLKQPIYSDYIAKIKDVESRIRSAIDMGYVIKENGELLNIRTPDSLNLLGKLIEGNVDSPNLGFYEDIISLWKMLLGNTIKPTKYVNGHMPLVVPSALEQYQTTFRDPAFYMIFNRVFKFFDTWASYLPPYTFEELSMPSVKIEEVQVDKLVTYFENVYVNITNQLYMTDKEAKELMDDTKIVVQQAALNHKPFTICVHVNSEVAETVVVKFFLGPKYDSMGNEIPLHKNTVNFFQMDQFVFELTQGKNVICRDSNQNMYMINKWSSAAKIYDHAFKAYNGEVEFILDESELFNGYVRNLMIPKGRVDGMPFVFMVYINKFIAPKDPYGTGANPSNVFGLGTGSRRMTNKLLKSPLDRPLHEYQIYNVHNIYFKDVQIFHKPIPEMYNPF